MKKIYATRPVNVGGTLYQAGEEIQCGAGAKESLFRFGQAADKATAACDSLGDSANQIDTDLAELNLEDKTISVLQENKINTIDDLCSVIDSGSKLSSFSGIGEATEKKILASLEKYLKEDRDEDEQDGNSVSG